MCDGEGREIDFRNTVILMSSNLGSDHIIQICLLPDTGARSVDSLLNPQILPALSQQLLAHMVVRPKPQHLTLGWDEEEGIVMTFDE